LNDLWVKFHVLIMFFFCRFAIFKTECLKKIMGGRV
jgi:hypothetical protein